MTDEPPLACALDASELPRRLAEMAAVGRSGLIEVQAERRSARLRFRRGAETAERLAAIVAAESECCAFLTMRLDEELDALLLAIDAPTGAEPVLEQLVEAFSGRPT